MADDAVFAEIDEACAPALLRLLDSRVGRGLAAGTLPLEAYKLYLRETYHFTRHTPRFLAAAASRFPSSLDPVLQRFLKHGLEEYGHDRMALRDLVALGEDEALVVASEPLIGTTAMIAFHYFVAERLDPVGLLGTIYAMENLGQGRAGGVADALVERGGIPREAVSFLAAHGVLDVAHLRDAKATIVRYVRSEAHLRAITYCARAGFELYELMFRQIWDRYEAIAPAPASLATIA